MIGYIKIFRKITDHWLWSKPEYFQWWMDILLQANFEPKTLLIKNQLLFCDRGDVLYSLETWSKRWKTNKSKVKRFLEMLEKDDMICIKSETVTTRITICNYDSYQGERNDSETQVKRNRNASETQVKPTKESKESKEGNNVITESKKEEIQDDIFKQVSTSYRWLEVMAKNHSTDIDLVIEHLRTFYWHCIAYDYWKSTESKVKQHFNNWVNKGNPIPKKKKESDFIGYD